MTPRTFYEKLADAQQQRRSDVALLLAPKLSRMPLPIAAYDDPFLPFGKAIIDVTRDLVCAYVFDLAAYLALGAAGAIALERTIAYARADGTTVTILDAPFATGAYVEAASDGGFCVDGVTVTQTEAAAAYTAEQGRAAFVVVAVPNQHLPGVDLYLPHESRFLATDGAQGVYQIRLLGESYLYAGSREDFAEQVRAAVSAEKTHA